MITVIGYWGCTKQSINLNRLTPEQQLEHAKRIFNKKNYFKSKMQFSIIVLNNPGSRIIEEAQYYLAESHLYLKEYLLAIMEYEKLSRSLPNSPYVEKSQFKIGICYYKLSPGYALDPENTYKAITQFQIFLEEFPESELKKEAEEYLTELRNKLAKKEFKTGVLYKKMAYFKAAIISFETVLESYYDTKFGDDALYLKGECHRKLGELEEAEKTFRELLVKYKDSGLLLKAKEKLKNIKEKQLSLSNDKMKLE
jgi:outer membrane protein assembly factor BamD